MDPLYTIGHSNHSMEAFLALLRMYGVEAVFDVRSKPYSRFHPQFCYRPLARSLEQAGIRYVFSGKELGARPDDPGCYEQGYIDFARLASRPEFAKGLERLCGTAATMRCCMMCAEKEPMRCHRMLLVCRQLRDTGICMLHILADGRLESQSDTEKRMMRLHGLDQQELFGEASAEALDIAYDRQIASVVSRK